MIVTSMSVTVALVIHVIHVTLVMNGLNVLNAILARSVNQRKDVTNVRIFKD